MIIGHRGASEAAPENTPRAFRLAAEMGADGVELDVRRAADGRLLVHHDPLAGVADLDSLPTLGEALDACRGLLVNVEIKPPEEPPDRPGGGVDPLVEATLAELAGRGRDEVPRWLVSSFSWDVIARCRVVDDAIATAYLCVQLDRQAVERVADAGHLAVHPHVAAVDAELVEQCHHAGLAVNTWTCNEPSRLVELAAIGVDGVCTDVPDVAIAALGRQRDAGSDPIGVSRSWGRRA